MFYHFVFTFARGISSLLSRFPISLLNVYMYIRKKWETHEKVVLFVEFSCVRF